jgi:DNA-binding LacI/PurR family transcriptional regulator
MAIVGFDGIESTTWTSPQLSTAAQPWKAMAETAVDILLGWREKKRHKKHHHLETEILWRGSTD